MKPKRQPQGQPRKIVGFHQDEDLDWVAELECGHQQHVRHDPPWTVRHWVTTAEGRQSHIGKELQCLACAVNDEIEYSRKIPMADDLKKKIAELDRSERELRRMKQELEKRQTEIKKQLLAGATLERVRFMPNCACSPAETRIARIPTITSWSLLSFPK